MKLLQYFPITFIVCLLCTNASANSDFFGSWANLSSGDQINILDGFKAGAGPVLFIEENGNVSTDKWEEINGEFKLTLNYDQYKVELNSDKNLVLTPGYGNPILFKPTLEEGDQLSVNIKEDEVEFLEALKSFEWLTSLEGQTALFKTTFGTDSGVIELTKSGKLNDLISFGVSSGVLKLGSDVIVEAKITNKYFVGVNERDKFVVFKSLQTAPALISTNLEKQREEFFDKLLTGEWQTKGYGVDYIHKFRPIYGELAGEVFTTRDDRLYEDNKWEYSPSTGAIKIGYTEYVGALIVNETLALIEKDGDQKFYNRAFSSSDKRYTLGDVKSTALNENSLQKINEMLKPQFQRDDYLYSFEFKQDGRTGFSHKWNSEPFDITGETFRSDMIGKSEQLFQVEDFIVFDEQAVYKMDSSASRLRPKSDDEVAQDVSKQEQIQNSAQTTSVLVRILTTDGKIKDVPLPITSFQDVANISILTE